MQEAGQSGREALQPQTFEQGDHQPAVETDVPRSEEPVQRMLQIAQQAPELLERQLEHKTPKTVEPPPQAQPPQNYDEQRMHLQQKLRQRQMQQSLKLNHTEDFVKRKAIFCDIAHTALAQIKLLEPQGLGLELFCRNGIQQIMRGEATIQTLIQQLGSCETTSHLQHVMKFGMKGLLKMTGEWSLSDNLLVAPPLSIAAATLAVVAGAQAITSLTRKVVVPKVLVTELPASIAENYHRGEYGNMTRADLLALMNATGSLDQYQKLRNLLHSSGPKLGLPCAVGEKGCKHAGLLMCCRTCPRNFHYECIQPALSSKPNLGTWICPVCVNSGKELSQLRREQNQRLQQNALHQAQLKRHDQQIYRRRGEEDLSRNDVLEGERQQQRRRSRKSRELGIKRRHTAPAAHDLANFIVDSDEDDDDVEGDESFSAELDSDAAIISSEEGARKRQRSRRGRHEARVERKDAIVTRQRNKNGLQQRNKKKAMAFNSSDEEGSMQHRQKELDRDAEAEEGIKAEKALAIKAKEQTEAIRNAKPMSLASLKVDGVEAEVPGRIAHHLQKHQIEGVQFMWDTVVKGGKGCCLAHCMGLGKTFQVAALVHAIVKAKFPSPEGGSATREAASIIPNKNDSTLATTLKNLKCILCIVPVNVLINWQEEFYKWVGDDVNITLLQDAGNSTKKRLAHLAQWTENGGVLVVGYASFRSLCQKPQFSKILLESSQLVICDEGHMLRNSASGISKVMSTIRSQLRIVLTGTPLQNNLFEYHTMIDWVRPGMLGTPAYFKKHFVTPILSGQSQDSSPEAVKLMQRRSHVLSGLLSGSVNRKQTSCLAEYLPKKVEHVVCIKLSPLQVRLYTTYLALVSGKRHTSSVKDDIKQEVTKEIKREINTERGHGYRTSNLPSSSGSPTSNFSVQQNSTQMAPASYTFEATHSALPPLPNPIAGFNTGYPFSAVGLQQPSSPPPPPPIPPSPPPPSPVNRGRGRPKKIGQGIYSVKRNNTRNTGKMLFQHYHELARVWSHPAVLLMEEETDLERKKKGYDSIDDFVVSSSDESWSEDGGEAARERRREHHRRRLEEQSSSDPDEEKEKDAWFKGMLKGVSCRTGKIKPELSGKVVFLLELLKLAAQKKEKVLLFTQSLAVIELLERVLDFEGFGSLGKDYFKLDGSTPPETRQGWVSRFNDPRNHRARLFLISTRAGGLGVNLTGGNRVVVFDASWNPSYDTQAIARSFRFGQTKNVFVYRLLAQGTMEEKIYGRQVNKNALAARVVDMEQVGRKYTEAELLELYEFKAEGSEFAADKSRQALLNSKLEDSSTQSSTLPTQDVAKPKKIAPPGSTDVDDPLSTDDTKKSILGNDSQRLKEVIARVDDAVLRRLIEQLSPQGLIGNFFEAKSLGEEDMELSPEEAAAAVKEYENELETLRNPPIPYRASSRKDDANYKRLTFLLDGAPVVRFDLEVRKAVKPAVKRRKTSHRKSQGRNSKRMMEDDEFPSALVTPSFSFPPAQPASEPPSFSFEPTQVSQAAAAMDVGESTDTDREE